jgi:hypothetical protein
MPAICVEERKRSLQTHNCLLCQVTNIAAGSAAAACGVNLMKEKCMHVATNPSKPEGYQIWQSESILKLIAVPNLQT